MTEYCVFQRLDPTLPSRVQCENCGKTLPATMVPPDKIRRQCQMPIRATPPPSIKPVACRHLGAIAAVTENRVALRECRSSKQPTKLCHEKLALGLVQIQPIGQTGVRLMGGNQPRTAPVASCVGCEWYERPPTWEEYLAETAGQCGTILHGILADHGYHLQEGCSCRTTIRRMNTGGPAWCSAHQGFISDEMLAEAKRRKVKIGMLGIRREPTDDCIRLQAYRWIRQAIKEAK